MGLRPLLALLFLGSLAVLGIFITFTASAFWANFGMYLPSDLTFGFANVSIPIQDIFLVYGLLLLLLTVLVFAFLFLLLERLIIHPVRAITRAMEAFAETRTIEKLLHVSLTTTEIRELAKVFVEFTDNVEEVHEKDMEVSRVKSDFISTAAHQLRTPLTGIRWALEALAKEDLTDLQKQMVENAANKSRDLVSIVGMLLDISSIESGKHKYNFIAVDLQGLAEHVVNDFTVQSAETQVKIIVMPPEQKLSLVRADADQIKWVLNNLIENGLRYTPAGGSVTVSFAELPGKVQVFVRDTGIGISAQDRNNIFERFFRAENAIAKENKGNGLGLYIARTVATDHGGDLTFMTNPKSIGTTFTLTIPVMGTSS